MRPPLMRHLAPVTTMTTGTPFLSRSITPRLRRSLPASLDATAEHVCSSNSSVLDPAVDLRPVPSLASAEVVPAEIVAENVQRCVQAGGVGSVGNAYVERPVGSAVTRGPALYVVAVAADE